MIKILHLAIGSTQYL